MDGERWSGRHGPASSRARVVWTEEKVAQTSGAGAAAVDADRVDEGEPERCRQDCGRAWAGCTGQWRGVDGARVERVAWIRIGGEKPGGFRLPSPRDWRERQAATRGPLAGGAAGSRHPRQLCAGSSRRPPTHTQYLSSDGSVEPEFPGGGWEG